MRKFLLLSLLLSLLVVASVAEAGSVTLKSGVALHYDVTGPADAPPLVLLHGLGDTKRSWSLVLPELAKAHRVYTPDLRGHGSTSAPVCCYSLADLSYDVVAFMDAMKLSRASVVGHSLGSFVAQRVAADHPQRVQKLVLIGSSDTAAGAEALEWLWEQVLTFERNGISASFVDQWQTNPLPVDAEFIAHVKRETTLVQPHVWKGIAKALMIEDQSRFVRELNVPTLILWGEKDQAFPLPHQQRLQTALPHATFKAYAEAGHNPHWEIPMRVAEDLRAFLR